jgi:hypothetical protein
MKSKKPILVTGSHRSGTTWIGQTISQHPRVSYVHEPFNVSHPNPIVGLELDTWFSHYQSSNQKEAIITSFNNLLRPNPLKNAVNTCKTAGMDIKTPLRFGKHLLFELFSRPRILIKDPIALLSAGWLHEKYGLKVIVMIRNPLAFVGSLKKAGWDFDFENLRKQEILMEGWLNRFAQNIEYMCTPEGRNDSDLIDRAALLWNILHYVILEYQVQYPEWLFVRHEDISMNPRPEFHRIFDYLGLESDDKILRYIESYTSQINPKEAASTSYQPRDSKLLLRTWKERLSNQEAERVKVVTS